MGDVCLVNHLFEGNKDPHPSSPQRLSYLYFPCFPHPPEALPATLSAFFFFSNMQRKLAGHPPLAKDGQEALGI